MTPAANALGDGVPELKSQLSTAQSATASHDLVLARGGRT